MFHSGTRASLSCPVLPQVLIKQVTNHHQMLVVESFYNDRKEWVSCSVFDVLIANTKVLLIDGKSFVNQTKFLSES